MKSPEDVPYWRTAGAEDRAEFMSREYKRDQDDFFQSMQDLEDEANQRESRLRQTKLRTLADGLQLSLESLKAFERQGIAAEPREMLAVWKQCIPEVWNVPESKALIDFLIPYCAGNGPNGPQ